MKSNPLVSVVIPTYNRSKYLELAINSVLSQTHQNIQLIIVDDGSTDNTEHLVKTINDPRIDYYRLANNMHICYALNYGLNKVRGQYIARLDDDDEFMPTKLEHQLDFLCSQSDYRVCFTKPILVDEHSQPIDCDAQGLFETPPIRGQSPFLERFFFHGNFLCHSSVMLERSVLQEVGRYNLAYLQLQDFDLWIRIAQKYPMCILDEPLCKMRQTTQGVRISRASEHSLIRTLNEQHLILRSFFEAMEDQLFAQTFRQYFRNQQAASAMELACEQAFLYAKIGKPEITAEKLAVIFNKAYGLEVLESCYNYTLHDYYREHLDFLIHLPSLQQQISMYEQQLAALQQPRPL